MGASRRRPNGRLKRRTPATRESMSPSVLVHATEIKGVLNEHEFYRLVLSRLVHTPPPSLHHFVMQGLLPTVVVLGCGVSLFARVWLYVDL